MRIGYARVSTDKQEEALQIDALKAAGCEKIFVDRVSGTLHNRPQLDAMLAVLRPQDEVVVWKLDRLGRSLVNLVELVTGFGQNGIDLVTLTGGLEIDTRTTGGKLMFHIFAALAEYEVGVIRERTVAGLAAARARGRIGGRPRALKPAQVAKALDLLANGASMRQAARELKASSATLHRYVKATRVAQPVA